jgi:hypothetical protein
MAGEVKHKHIKDDGQKTLPLLLYLLYCTSGMVSEDGKVKGSTAIFTEYERGFFLLIEKEKECDLERFTLGKSRSSSESFRRTHSPFADPKTNTRGRLIITIILVTILPYIIYCNHMC